MFVGRPPGNYDRLLDFSRAVTGTLFFVPSATLLESVNDDAFAATMPATLHGEPHGREDDRGKGQSRRSCPSSGHEDECCGSSSPQQASSPD
jgi:putative iron-dependent peroxidase